MKKTPTHEQMFVLRKLAADHHRHLPPGSRCSCDSKGLCDVCLPDGGKIAYYKGGFWSTPGQEVRIKVIDAAPKDWHTTRQTVEAMERRGWLRRLETATNYDGRLHHTTQISPSLVDRQITAEGLALVEMNREEPQRLDPDDGKIHVRITPSTPTAMPVLCGRTGAASVSSASGWWGPGGRGFADVCPRCYEIESSKYKLPKTALG